MSRPRYVSKVLAAIAATTLLLGACGGGDDDGGSTGETSGGAAGSAGDLLIWVGEGTGGEAVKEVAAGFGEENNVNVTVETLPGDQLQSGFVTASQAGNAPDVVFGAHDWIGNLVQNGAVDPIQLPPTVSDTIQEIAVKAVTFNSQVYGLPITMNNIVLYRNTDLAPDAPETIEDLVEAGKALQSSGDVEEVLAYPVGSTGNPYFINPLYTSGGGYMFGTNAEGDFDPADLGVGTPGSVEAYEKIGELGEGGEDVLKRSISADNALTLFTGGEAAFLVEGPWQLPNLAEVDFDYDVSPVPGFADGDTAAPFITVDAAYVASQGENKTLAQEFVTNYFSRTDVLQAYFEASQGVPASQAVLDAMASSQPLAVKVAEIGATQGQIMPSIPEMAAVWDPLGKAEAAVISGADPATTIDAAASTIEKSIG
jgi:arabinogalactan oligomer/maltooligosaccharide transport system substrate-binding protein